MRLMVLLMVMVGLSSQTIRAAEGEASGLPVPRFVSMAAGEANMRTGPGAHYPIDWVYKRRGLPLKVVEDYDNWRRVEDADGVSGWFHVQLLSSRRTASIITKIAHLRAKPDPRADTVITAEKGVIGTPLGCKAGWCKLEIEGRSGWLKPNQIFGVLAEDLAGQ